MSARASGLLAALALAGIVAHLILRYLTTLSRAVELPLLAVLLVGGVPLVLRLAWRALHGELGSDHLAGVSIIASALLGEYLAGAIVVLMLSGGETLEQFAVAEATAVLRALAKRAPTLAHRRRGAVVEEVPVAEVAVGDEVSVLPHEICPVDGEVLQGHGTMDESYLTGEPFRIAKGPGAQVLSGAINGEASLTVRASRVAADSRYARIMQVMQEAEQRRPNLRRIGDQLGGWYTPLALTLASVAWWWTGNPIRFLSVVVVATPCPLLIAIPVAIIGSISTAARRGVIIKDPAALEQLTLCRTMILDKTGTLTYGRPSLSDEVYAPPFDREAVLPIVAAIETYSRHPLAGAIVQAATDAGYALTQRRLDPRRSRASACTPRSGARRCWSRAVPTRRPGSICRPVWRPVSNASCSSMTTTPRPFVFTTCRAPRATGSSVIWVRSTSLRACCSSPAIGRPR